MEAYNKVSSEKEVKRKKNKVSYTLLAGLLIITHGLVIVGGYEYRDYLYKEVRIGVHASPELGDLKVIDSPPVEAPSPTLDSRAVLNIDNVTILINEQRLSAGREQAGVSKSLNARASKWSSYLNQSNLCEHDQSQDTYAEIISCGYTSSREAVTSWMNSPTHKDILLDKRYHNMGIGISGNIIVIYFSN